MCPLPYVVFIISNQSPDILKPELPLHGKENKKSKGNSEAVQLSDDCTGKLDCVTPGSSAREVISKLLDETLELAIKLPIIVKATTTMHMLYR